MDDEEEFLPPGAIDGQIEIGELFVHEEEKPKNDDEREKIEVADGQMSILDELLAKCKKDSLQTKNVDENQTQKEDENLKSKDSKDKSKTLNSLLAKIGGEPSKVVKNITSENKTPSKDAKTSNKPAKVEKNVEKATKKTEKDENLITKSQKSSSKSTKSATKDSEKGKKGIKATKVEKEQVLKGSKLAKGKKGNEEELTSTKKEAKVDKEAKNSKKEPEIKKSKSSSRKKAEEVDPDIFFDSDENQKVRHDVEDLNKGFEEVDRNVGRNVFADLGDRDDYKNLNRVDIEEKVYMENSGENIGDGLLYKNLDTVLHESMIPYSEHVILDRALPRVEDGLKPVQRRILFAMHELGNTPDKPFKKSARIVGETLGKYHPHGDASVYDAMVRLAQNFNMRNILVEGNGNFGSVDGDPPAAARYTEVRLAPIALELLRDLDKNTVKWGLNFDDTQKEPQMLPGRFPNILVNGSSGIAVGLATNIPTHNLAETIDGVVAYIDNPNITLKQMMKIIKGPDFPTGGYILESSELYKAYETGRGKIYIRAKMHIEGAGTDRKSIVITELPYQVNKASLLQKIAGFKDEGKFGFEGIAEIRDESDRHGQRAVLRLKKDVSVNKIYESLLKNTELQGTFGVNMVAIAGGKPKQMGLLDIISYYSEYQREVVLRRSKYDLEQAEERAHILEGLIIAIKNIDAVVKIIKTSPNTTEAKKRLREKFILDDRQAQAILDMRLARLTSLEVNKLQEELKGLKILIKELKSIVESPRKQYEVVKSELLQIKKQYKSERLTKFLKDDEKLVTAEEIAEKENDVKELVLLKTADEYFKAVPLKQYNLSAKELGEGSTLSQVHTLKLNVTSTSNIIAFTNFGNCLKMPISAFGESRYRDKGAVDYSIFRDLGKDEHIVALFDEKDVKGKENLIFLTKFGMIKKTAREEYTLLKKTYQAIKLKEGDELLSVVPEPKEDWTIIFVTKDGMVLNAKTDDIPLQGRVAGGVKGVALGAKDICVCASICQKDAGEVLIVCDKGLAKRTTVKSIEQSVRYRKGQKIVGTGNNVVFADVITEPKTLCVIDSSNELHFKTTDLVVIDSRTGKGKPFDKQQKNLAPKKAFLPIT